VGVDRTLPREEFFNRQLVSSADFLKAYHAGANSVDDYSFAPGYPAFCIGGRQVEVAILRAGASVQNLKEPAVAVNVATMTSIHLTCTRNVRERWDQPRAAAVGNGATGQPEHKGVSYEYGNG
jgi:hypothetical protein